MGRLCRGGFLRKVERFEIILSGQVGGAIIMDAPLREDDASRAVLSDGVDVVRNQDDCPSLAVEVSDLPNALRLEVSVADGEDFIHHQNRRRQMGCHRETQARHHAA